MIRAIVLRATGGFSPADSRFCDIPAVRPCLRFRVRARGINRPFFVKEQIRAIQRQVVVVLVGGYLMIALNTVLAEDILQSHSSDSGDVVPFTNRRISTTSPQSTLMLGSSSWMLQLHSLLYRLSIMAQNRTSFVSVLKP